LKERNGRMLTWLGNLGSADIKCTFPRIPGKEGSLGRERRHEINVTTHSMVILLLFNDLEDDESLSFEEIRERTNIPQQNLVHLLYTLSVLPKCKVLNKHPPKDRPKPGDMFSFNSSFQSKSIKIKAPVISGSVNKVEGDDERKDTEDRNDEHRGSLIDTVIVRIMKFVSSSIFLSKICWLERHRARKAFSHQQLFAEVIAQLSQRFRPDINMMKRRVESLIEREYLARVEDAAVPTYQYLA
jgi:cullin 3